MYACPAGRVACPPEDLPRCPGRNALGCGRGPENSTGWPTGIIPCNPLVTPQDKGMTFWCSLNRTAGSGSPGDGSHLCYWTQHGGDSVLRRDVPRAELPLRTLSHARGRVSRGFHSGGVLDRRSHHPRVDVLRRGGARRGGGALRPAESRSLCAGKTAAQALEEAANAPRARQIVRVRDTCARRPACSNRADAGPGRRTTSSSATGADAPAARVRPVGKTYGCTPLSSRPRVRPG